jgi:hypothetical protein
LSEAVVLFFLGEREPRPFVDAPSVLQHVVCPQHHSLVAGALRETSALLAQARTDAHSTHPRFNQHQPKLRHRLLPLHAEDAPSGRAVHLGYPGGFARGIPIVKQQK